MIYLHYKDTKTFGHSFSFLLIFKTLRASYLQVGNFSNKVVNRCLSTDAADRYNNIGEVAIAVKRADRRPVRFAAVVASVLFLIALAAIVFLPKHTSQAPTEQPVTTTKVAPPPANATKDAHILSPDKVSPTSTNKPSATKTGKLSAPFSTKTSSTTSKTDRMIVDIHRETDAIYAATLKQFEGQNEISGIAFSAPFEEYHRRTEQLKRTMAKAHPSVPPVTISTEVDKYTSKIVYPIAVKVKPVN